MSAGPTWGDRHSIRGDDVHGGEQLLASVYAAIRESPYWNNSLLIITYDEHGGFYDCVAPGVAVGPGDNPNYGPNKHGFDFTQYGVRVPAVVVSPLIPGGTVDHTVYDHTSILKTITQLFGLGPLTDGGRAVWANPAGACRDRFEIQGDQDSGRCPRLRRVGSGEGRRREVTGVLARCETMRMRTPGAHSQRIARGASRMRITLAGTPPTTAFAGTSLVTTELVPMTLLSPTLTPRRMHAP